MIYAALFILLVVILGVVGGQKNKGARRFGIPMVSFFASLGKPFSKKNIIIFSFIGLLSIGYGENSWAYTLFGNDTLVRIAYGAMLAIPFVFYGFKKFLIALPILIIAFSIHAGSFTFGKLDILCEDIIRYSALGSLIFSLIIVREDE